MKRSVLERLIRGVVVVGVVIFLLSIQPASGKPATARVGSSQSADPGRLDSDGDGIPDGSDNCPYTYNPDQLDFDGFEKRMISEEVVGPASVFVADVDGDGDDDVLSASTYDDKIAWYENTDGAGNFGPQIVISAAADFAHIVSAGDLDRDGDIDVLSASWGDPDNILAWYENLDGAGTFGPQWVIAAQTGTFNSVYAADLDGDLDNDILVGASNGIGWHENLDGEGNFGPRIAIASAGVGFAVAIDVDRDSHVDVVGAGWDGLWWYRNMGSASFFSSNAISADDYIGPVFVTDVDGDADADVLAIHEEYVDINFIQTLVWHENTDGVGGFGPQNPISVVGVNEVLPFSLFAADMELDGDIDVLSADGTWVGWYENLDGDGEFGPGQAISVNDLERIDSIFGVDVEDDGDPDVVVAAIWDDKIVWFKNGDGVGVACDNCPDVLNADQADADLDDVGDVCDNCPDDSNADQADTDLDDVGDVCDNCPDDANSDQADSDLDQLGNVCDNCPGDPNLDQSDLDSDGFGDLCDNCPDDSNIAQQDADGDDVGDVCDCDPSNAYCTTDCTDTDGDGYCVTHDCSDANPNCESDCTDGDSDGFCPPHDCNEAILHLSDRDGDAVPDPCDNCPDVANRDQLDFDSFGPQRVISTAALGAWSVFAADLDGDDDTDVLSASYDGIDVTWYENLDGAGNFGPPILISDDATGAQSVYAIDLDGDGDVDVLSASSKYGEDKLAWYENTDGAGSFGAQQLISDNLSSTTPSIIAADLDLDGDADVVVSDNRIEWYENTDGAGSFGPRRWVAYYNTSDVTSIFVADVDGDGDNDVLAADDDDDTISWYENIDGAGNFESEQVISTNADEAWSVFAADVDGDGDMDALSASRYDDKVAWYENTDGLGGSWLPWVISTTAPEPRAVSAGDVDGDGDVDVFSVSWVWDGTDPLLAWYENTDGLGSFGPLQAISTELNRPRSVFVADVDGDGDIDALSASSDDNKIAWYETVGDGAGDVCDCAPSDPLLLEPPDVAGLNVRHIGGAHWGWGQLIWSAAPGADTYSVTRGAVSGLAEGQYGVCLVQDVAVTRYVDSSVPTAGTAYAYLVQGVSAQCGTGTLGFGAGGVERVNLDPGACP
jgi:hypothetical protein